MDQDSFIGVLQGLMELLSPAGAARRLGGGLQQQFGPPPPKAPKPPKSFADILRKGSRGKASPFKRGKKKPKIAKIPPSNKGLKDAIKKKRKELSDLVRQLQKIKT